MTNRNTRTFIGKAVAFAVVFALLALPAVQAGGRHHGRRHRGISEGRLNTALAIGTGLAILDIVTRPAVEQTTVYTLPATTTTTTTTYYGAPGITYQQTTYAPPPPPPPRVTYNVYAPPPPPPRHHVEPPRSPRPSPGVNHGAPHGHDRDGKPGVHHRR